MWQMVVDYWPFVVSVAIVLAAMVRFYLFVRKTQLDISKLRIQIAKLRDELEDPERLIRIANPEEVEKYNQILREVRQQLARMDDTHGSLRRHVHALRHVAETLIGQSHDTRELREGVERLEAELESFRERVYEIRRQLE